MEVEVEEEIKCGRGVKGLGGGNRERYRKQGYERKGFRVRGKGGNRMF